MSQYAIHTRDLTKDFASGFWRNRRQRALDRLTLEVGHGEVLGLLGPNGAGKTTTLKLLMQLLFPTSGAAWMLGEPVGSVAVRRRLGYLPENPYFYDNLTAEELLVYFAGLFGWRGPDRRQRAARLLDEVEVGAERRLRLRSLSKGLLQRVGIAQALVNDPEVVILDEPLSGLDPLGRRKIRALVMSLRNAGRTVLFSSHILGDAEAMCSRVAILVGGRLAAVGRLADVLAPARGWEVVVDDADPATVDRVRAWAVRVTRIADGRVEIELPGDQPPDHLLSQLVSRGARLVSLNPIHDTLEEYFVRQVAREQPAAATGARRGADTAGQLEPSSG